MKKFTYVLFNEFVYPRYTVYVGIGYRYRYTGWVKKSKLLILSEYVKLRR